MSRQNLAIVLLCCVGACLMACHKDFLDEKPDQSLLVPKALDDYQKILDNLNIMNYGGGLSIMAGDEFYNDNLEALSLAAERNAYKWADDVYEGFANVADWVNPYQQIFYANIVLEGIDDDFSGTKGEQQVKDIYGAALFYRGLALYNLLQQFAPAYGLGDPENTPGLPVRTYSNVNSIEPRSSLATCYRQVLQDIASAAELLTAVSVVESRPNRIACHALLARVFLTMGNYDEALHYADRVIEGSGGLLDYNSLNSDLAAPFPTIFKEENEEVIFYSRTINYSFYLSNQSLVDSLLYETYSEYDLRKRLYFTYNEQSKGFNFKGSYTGDQYLFTGIALDEIYLIKAECLARKGKGEESLNTLNSFLETRFERGRYEKVSALEGDDLVDYILAERHKQLIGRNLRWTDLKRFNLEANRQKILSKVVNGEELFLKPNDLKYLFPLPDSEIAGGHIDQNTR